MATQPQHRLIPIYSSRGEAEAFLVFPYLFNRSGEWVGWVTPKREVYSVLGNYVGSLTDDTRIVRKRADDDNKPHLKPPPYPGKITTPASIPLAPLMTDLTLSFVDVLMEEPERLHTLDSGELREDMD
jgi:4-fold beta-flower domain-containing protein